MAATSDETAEMHRRIQRYIRLGRPMSPAPMVSPDIIPNDVQDTAEVPPLDLEQSASPGSAHGTSGPTSGIGPGQPASRIWQKDLNVSPLDANTKLLRELQEGATCVLLRLSAALKEHRDSDALAASRELDTIQDYLEKAKKIKDTLEKSAGISNIVPKTFPLFQISRWSKVRNPSKEIFDTTREFLNIFEQCIEAYGLELETY